MIYAYGICESRTPLPSSRGRGLGGARLRALQCGELAAIYSRHRSLRVQPAAEQLLRHERVIETMMADGAVLPLRFGTQLAREEQLATVLAQRSESLLLALDRVRGHVELGLRAIPELTKETNGEKGARTGREFMLERVQRHQRALRVVRDLHGPLSRLATASTVRDYPRPPAILVASYLVGDERVPGFRRQAEQLAAQQDGMRVLVTGPWPPYSFAETDKQ